MHIFGELHVFRLQVAIDIEKKQEAWTKIMENKDAVLGIAVLACTGELLIRRISSLRL